MLASFLCGDFLLHIPCWLYFYVGSFSYTSRASFAFIWVVFLTHPMLALLFCGEFLLHIPRWLHFFLIWGVSLTYHMLASFLSGEFLLHIPCWFYFHSGNISYIPHAAFIFCGASLSDTSCAAFIFMREFLLHIPSCLHFYVRSCLHFYAGSFS